MCGIFVLYNIGCDKKYSDLNKALKHLSHRGPDNVGDYYDEYIYMGHTRLSIIDKGESANQPYRYKDLIMVYNGEVFNYLELKYDLESKGYTFDTTSDTEVVIKAYDCYGEKCFEQFNGMWALAIYNKQNRELLISRDRFGQKPLFLSKDGKEIYFASEIHLITQFVDIKPNYYSIEKFLKESDYDVSGNTFFENIYEYPSATLTKINLSGKEQIFKYWNYPNKIRTRNNVYKEFKETLRDAVDIRLRTDVGYSLMLSGGCDSTIISGITREIVGEEKNITAFTYSSMDKYDEIKYAKSVADDLKIQLNVSSREENPEQYINRLRRIVKNMGRGHSSPAIISIDYLYRKVRESGYKVALDGQGADELLAGYSQYHIYHILDMIKEKKYKEIYCTLYNLIKRGVLKSLILFFRSVANEKIKKIMRNMYGYERIFSGSNNKKIDLFNNYLTEKRSSGYLNAYLVKQHRIGLLNLLYYGDIVAMLNSVENRSPFMDHRLVEIVFSSGNEIKVKNGLNKAVLRDHEIYKKYKKILDRPKIGFESAIGKKIKEQFVRDLMKSPIIEWPIFNKKEMIRFLTGGKALENKYERILFRIYQLHLWDELFTKK